MKKLILPILVLMGCLDLSTLTSQRCPDYDPCKADQKCIQGTCVDILKYKEDMSTSTQDMKTTIPDLTQPKVDMKLDPTSDTCFKTYMSKYYTQNYSLGSCWMPSYWQANNFKECRPPNCLQDNPIHCSGEMVQRFICPSLSLDMYTYGPLNTYYAAIVSTLSNETYYEFVTTTTGRVCERSPKIGPTICPEGFTFYGYLCETLI